MGQIILNMDTNQQISEMINVGGHKWDDQHDAYMGNAKSGFCHQDSDALCIDVTEEKNL